MNITRQTSQITVEVRRIDNNKSVTKKVREKTEDGQGEKLKVKSK